ncbi:hypothetical protein HPB50_003473 [Hyalomma asiaticum]|uniref:Uncharacterized protein n=1 Tax=Hyalomma asiaticum TaxID=266040 RepID=A0ACB7S1A8_HYAAI|nr:hypothetical protein HPB50_003473 [Hyalomma asiaticum]
MRYNEHIALTACLIYIFLTGGLRGVVWTDCMQFIFILVAPTTVVLKIAMDSFRPNSTVQPFSSLDLQKYFGNYSMDITSDETIWACLFGSLGLQAYRMCMDQVVAQRLLACRTIKEAKSYSMDITSDETIWACLFGSLGLQAYRMCMDQVVAQRLLACRTIKEAKRTAVVSALLLFLLYMTGLALGVALTIWFRGCDPGLQGKIASMDQGAGIATLATIAYQILHVSRTIASGKKPPRMDASLDYCPPENQSTRMVAFNTSLAAQEA